MSSMDPTPETVSVEQPVIRRRRYFSVVWLVPIVAAIIGGYLIYERASQAGPLITIRFADGNGLRPGQSVVKYRGVVVGDVRSVSLSSDLKTTLVKVRLAKSAKALAREGTLFWIVRAEVGLQSITGLATIISGPYIEVQPGSGQPSKVFEGAPKSPITRDDNGLRIVLLSPTRGSLRAGSPVYYRGIEVGTVQEQRLSADARVVESDIFIEERYAPLVTMESKFWNVSGVNVDFGLFKGAQVNVESLKSLVSGGVLFATPARDAKPVNDGTTFRLYDEPRKEWLEWTPAIALTNRAGAADGEPPQPRLNEE